MGVRGVIGVVLGLWWGVKEYYVNMGVRGVIGVVLGLWCGLEVYINIEALTKGLCRGGGSFDN